MAAGITLALPDAAAVEAVLLDKVTGLLRPVPEP